MKLIQIVIGCKDQQPLSRYLSCESREDKVGDVYRKECCWTIGLADCLNSWGQLRVSVTGPPKAPLASPPSVPLSHPASIPLLSEGGRVGVGAEMAFVPFIESAASLSSHDQQAAAQWQLAEGCRRPIATCEVEKSHSVTAGSLE